MTAPARDDPFNLMRFVDAQSKDYAHALAELRAGKKQSHWIWYVLPQLRGLGSSSRAMFYGIASRQEAEAYLGHPILGPRLRECVTAMNAVDGSDAAQVLGPVDAAKFRSCLTLFRAVDPTDAIFDTALDKYFGGVPDETSLALLRASMNSAVGDIRAAGQEDVAAVTACVCAAYYRHIRLIGRQPGPMLEDYAKVMREHRVHVVERDRRIVGVLVLADTDEGLLIDNVAVDPSAQGSGVGRLLLEFAESEARRRGLPSIYLSTNEKMTENQALYARIGYITFDHRVINGYPRVFMRKELP
jgi:uncharacterized protein (DUF1810 family)/N-acetylglutamate synthase-like GNAT family acetyltransferase